MVRALSMVTNQAAMERMEEFGVPRKIVAFVMPTGYSFNLDGTTLYLSLATIFVAQISGGFDRRGNHEGSGQAIDQTGHEHRIESSRKGAKRGAGAGTGVKMRFARCQRRQRNRSTPDVDDFYV